MPERDDILAKVEATLREPVRMSSDFDARVMDEVLGLKSRPGRIERLVGWLRQPQFAVSPLGGMGWAAAVIVVTMLGVSVASRTNDPELSTDLASAGQPNYASQIQFVLVAPDAETVTVVGDFNDWDDGATPLAKTQGGGDGIWSVTVPLSPGRYQYSFIVDGTVWMKDPGAVPAMEDEFGRPSSVLTIGEV